MGTEQILLLVTSTLTGAAGWFVGRRKVNADTDTTVLSNLEISINVYRKIIEDLKREITELNLKITELETKVNSLLMDNSTLREKLKDYADKHP